MAAGICRPLGRRNQGAEYLEGGIDTGSITSGDEVEQEPSEERQTQTGPGALSAMIAEPGEAEGDDPIDPIVNEAGQQRIERPLAPARARVALKEEALRGPEARIAEALPHRNHRLFGLRVKAGQEAALLRLHLVNDGGEHALTRAEVVDEHPVTCADGGRDVAQRPIADPARLKIRHDGRQQRLLSHGR